MKSDQFQSGFNHILTNERWLMDLHVWLVRVVKGWIFEEKNCLGKRSCRPFLRTFELMCWKVLPCILAQLMRLCHSFCNRIFILVPGHCLSFRHCHNILFVNSATIIFLHRGLYDQIPPPQFVIRCISGAWHATDLCKRMTLSCRVNSL